MIRMLMKKRCLRCGGNIYLEEDSFGCWGYCLQCGYECDLENTIKSPKQLALSEMGKSPTQNFSKLARLKMPSDLLQGRLVAELKQD